MNRRELECLNSLVASCGIYFILEKMGDKFILSINNNGVISCGYISSNMMSIRKYIVNKIRKIRGL